VGDTDRRAVPTPVAGGDGAEHDEVLAELAIAARIRDQDARDTGIRRLAQVAEEFGVDLDDDRERPNAYPGQERYLLPTKLGNALRAGESYAWVQYGLLRSGPGDAPDGCRRRGSQLPAPAVPRRRRLQRGGVACP
jgi:hypothetical protein